MIKRATAVAVTTALVTAAPDADQPAPRVTLLAAD
jgi:hypothetical protein